MDGPVFRIHGLTIRAQCTLPGLARADVEHAEVELELVDALPAPVPVRMRYRNAAPGDIGARVEIVDDARGHVAFRYGDGTAIDLVYDTRPARIRAAIAPDQTLEDLTAYLYGPVIGFLLRAWGRLAMHASCVRIGDAAVLIAGPSGAGKSTTAAALATRGMTVLSDDLTALTCDEQGFMAWPAFDHVRLWQTSEHLVLGENDQLERITPTWDKRRFPLRECAFADAPSAVGAIVLLGARRVRGRVASRRVAPARALLTLTTLTYANYLLDASMRATELAQLGALVRAVPVHSLSAPSGPAGLDALCDAIVRIGERGAGTSRASERQASSR